MCTSGSAVIVLVGKAHLPAPVRTERQSLRRRQSTCCGLSRDSPEDLHPGRVATAIPEDGAGPLGRRQKGNTVSDSIALSFLGLYSQTQDRMDAFIVRVLQARANHFAQAFEDLNQQLTDGARLKYLAATLRQLDVKAPIDHVKTAFTGAKRVRDLTAHAVDVTEADAGGELALYFHRPTNEKKPVEFVRLSEVNLHQRRLIWLQEVLVWSLWAAKLEQPQERVHDDWFDVDPGDPRNLFPPEK